MSKLKGAFDKAVEWDKKLIEKFQTPNTHFYRI